MGGAIWDFVSPGLREPVRRLIDSSGNNMSAHIMGRAKLVAGHEEKGIDLNGHDQWVELYQDEKTEISGSELTVSIWVYPRKLMNKGGTLLTKGNSQFGLQQIGTEHIDFYIYTNKKEHVRATLPNNWIENWHHITAVYNGKAIQIYINGKLLAEKAVSGKIKNFPYPVCIGKNAETHGQNTTNYLCDAIIDKVAIFDKVIDSSSLTKPTVELKRKAALWLDFEQELNEGEFFSYGIGARTYGSIWPDRRPEPEMWQIKKTAQPITVRWSDAEQMLIEVYNRQFFSNTTNYQAKWNLEENGISIASGTFNAAVEPQEKETIQLPIQKPALKAGANYFLTLSFHLKAAECWAEKGYEIAWDQMQLPWVVPAINKVPANNSNTLQWTDLADKIQIKGKNFVYTFDKKNGKLLSMLFEGKELLKQAPKLNVWRAPLANELDEWTVNSVNVYPKNEGYGSRVATAWYSIGLDKMRYKPARFEVEKCGNNVVVKVDELVLHGNQENGGFENQMIYSIAPDAEITLTHTITPNGKMPMSLPRIGTTWSFDKRLQKVEWFGRGPEENYPDRKSGYRFGRYKTTVDEMFMSYLLPQDCGLRTDNSWVKLSDSEGAGIEFSSERYFNFNCYNYTTENMSKAKYTYQLKKSDALTFNFDYLTTGVGCTATGVMNKYQIQPIKIHFISRIKPFTE